MTIEDAWARVHDSTPAGWHVGRPAYNPGRRQWEMYAFDPIEKPVVGQRSRDWIAVGDDELEVIVEMGRCLAEISAGRVPR